MKPEVSVVIPTYQPDHVMLGQVLDGLKNQRAVNPDLFEVLIVDNPEATWTGEHLANSYGYRHLVCPKMGANAARNFGTEHAKAEIIALIDDDVVPRPLWMSRLLGIHGFFPKLGIVGGKLELKFLEDKPRWINGAFNWWLSEVDWPYDGFTDLARKSCHIVSGNMSYRRGIWEDAGGFPEWAGLRGRGVLTVNDEISFTKACGELGNPQVGYDPDLICDHLITPDRACLDYLKKRAYGQGYADGRDWMIAGHNEGLSIPDIYYKYVQSPAENFLYFGEICSTREQIAHEESTREYIRNIVICRSEYFKGIIDAIERDGEAIWKSLEEEAHVNEGQDVYLGLCPNG
jgi:glycosyltransferase involved in cell wall biosynthesis